MRISDWSSDVCSSDLLARPARDQRPRLGNQIGEGPARLGAARIGDDAIGAEFVAAFLHGQEGGGALDAGAFRSEEHTSELQSLMRISYAVFCLKKKKDTINNTTNENHDKRGRK